MPYHGNGNGTLSVIQSWGLTADPLLHTMLMDCDVWQVIYKIDIGLYFHLMSCSLGCSSNISWWALVCYIFIGDFWALCIRISISFIIFWKTSPVIFKMRSTEWKCSLFTWCPRVMITLFLSLFCSFLTTCLPMTCLQVLHSQSPIFHLFYLMNCVL